MFPRLRQPITLGVVMIVLLVVMIVLWVLLAVLGALADPSSGPFYVTVMTIGTVFLITLVVGVSLYLTLSVKTIRLSRRQSNFIDAVTHELKSPIASLKLYLQTLNRREMEHEERVKFYRTMLDDCERLDRLINQVLDTGRLERKTSDGEKAEIDLPALLKSCVETACLRYRVDESCVSFRLVPCVVHAERGELSMLFGNLIDNAVKYADSEPNVDVQLKVGESKAVVVRVADNGRGIPANMRRRVFGRFERLGGELTREKPGTGLGLYIAREIVKRMRGKIRILDRDDGPGTVFEVRMPRGEVEKT
jgi:two-component system phosphate regulon sensor histidine kinase PhoR